MKLSPDITRELQGLTGRLIAYRLYRRIKDVSLMSKFSELAGMTRDTLKKWDAEADDIMTEHHKLEAEGDDLFRRYRATQANKRAEFTQMRDAIRDLSGANLPDEQDLLPAEQDLGKQPAASPASSGSSPPGTIIPAAPVPTREPEMPMPRTFGRVETIATTKPALGGAPFPHQ